LSYYLVLNYKFYSDSQNYHFIHMAFRRVCRKLDALLNKHPVKNGVDRY